MAKAVVVTFAGQASSFDLAKLERAKLYGARRRLPLDAEGEPCRRAALTLDGGLLLQSGMSAQGYVSEAGVYVANDALVALDASGQAMEKLPTTLGEPQEAEEVPARRLFDVRVSAVYVLTPRELAPELAARLAAGAVLRIDFKFRPDFRRESAFLLQNDAGTFAVIGAEQPAPWLDRAVGPVVEATEEDDVSDLDLEMWF